MRWQQLIKFLPTPPNGLSAEFERIDMHSQKKAVHAGFVFSLSLLFVDVGWSFANADTYHITVHNCESSTEKVTVDSDWTHVKLDDGSKKEETVGPLGNGEDGKLKCDSYGCNVRIYASGQEKEHMSSFDHKNLYIYVAGPDYKANHNSSTCSTD